MPELRFTVSQGCALTCTPTPVCSVLHPQLMMFAGKVGHVSSAYCVAWQGGSGLKFASGGLDHYVKVRQRLRLRLQLLLS